MRATPTVAPQPLSISPTRIPDSTPQASVEQVPATSTVRPAEPSPVPTSLPEPTLPPATPTLVPTPMIDTAAEVAQLHALSDSYWGAFNSYDADAAVALYDEGYRLTREEQVRGDISRMKIFRITLGISEVSPATLTAPNVGELYIDVKNPLGVSRVRMIFHKLDGEWKIVYAEELDG